MILPPLAAHPYGTSMHEVADDRRGVQKTTRRDLGLCERLGSPIDSTIDERGRQTSKLAPLAVQ
jgi:hypothetical protein